LLHALRDVRQVNRHAEFRVLSAKAWLRQLFSYIRCRSCPSSSATAGPGSVELDSCRFAVLRFFLTFVARSHLISRTGSSNKSEEEPINGTSPRFQCSATSSFSAVHVADLQGQTTEGESSRPPSLQTALKLHGTYEKQQVEGEHKLIKLKGQCTTSRGGKRQHRLPKRRSCCRLRQVNKMRRRPRAGHGSVRWV
jgi:hypothetical protein